MTARRFTTLLLPMLAALPGCAALVARTGAAPIEVGILAINDFHGNLQPPHLAITAPDGKTPVPAGGAAYLASAIASLRRAHPNAITVSAGDMTGASPLPSSIFLDEPTIATMNAIGVDLNAVGNHEFDRGTTELLRLQKGGCARNATPLPCRLEKFGGARFQYLAGNTIMENGASLLPATAIRTFGQGSRRVTIGFIGLTTRTTNTLVSPTAIRGIHFADEADTANRLVPALRKAGADTIVLLVHEGGYPQPETDPNGCAGLSGPIVDIAKRLDPAIQVVVSGHTHKAYICPNIVSRPLLLTSAGKFGSIVTDMALRFDPHSKRLIDSSARNVIVQGEAFEVDGRTVGLSDAVPRFAADPVVGKIVDRYVTASGPLAERVVGHMTRAPAPKDGPPRRYETELGNLVADAQLAVMSVPENGGAQVAFMNPGGIRTDLKIGDGGAVTFADAYAVQPFGNVLMVREFTGAQLRAVLEQQFDMGGKTLVLSVAGMTYAFDRSRPAGQRIIDVVVQGRPLSDAERYRVSVSNFLAVGGDGFTSFVVGRDVPGPGITDVDALSDYLGRSIVTPPPVNRIADRTPPGWTAPSTR
jgi:5'-nucleotidase